MLFPSCAMSSMFLPRGTHPTLVSLACGDKYTMVLLEDGTLLASGDNQYGQLGLGDTKQRTTFTPVPDIRHAYMIACGTSHTLVGTRTPDGKMHVYSFGRNDYGQLGLNDRTVPSVSSPVEVMEFRNVAIQKLIASQNQSVALTAAGDAYVFGNNADCGLGSGQLETKLWHPFRTLTHVRHVACWENLIILGTRDNEVFVCGKFNSALVEKPLLIATFKKPITQLECGQQHCVITLSDNSVWAFGSNLNGQLGLKDKKFYSVCTALTATTANVPLAWQHKIEFVACGASHTVIVQRVEQLMYVHVIGLFSSSQTSQYAAFQTIYAQYSPAQFPGFIAAGQQFSVFGVRDSLSLVVLGQNVFGELGLGAVREVSTPTLCVSHVYALEN